MSKNNSKIFFVNIKYLFSLTCHLSAGHDKHEYTSGCAREEIFKFFFEENYLESKIQETEKY